MATSILQESMTTRHEEERQVQRKELKKYAVGTKMFPERTGAGKGFILVIMAKLRSALHFL